MLQERITSWARHTDEYVTGKPPKTLHSFQHLFVAKLRTTGADRDVVEALVGHSMRASPRR